MPELKAYVVWVLGRALGDRPEVQVWREGEARTYTQRTALDEVWNARGQMSPYGQALLTLALAAANDARADEGVKLLTASARTDGALAYWPGDRDPLLGYDGDIGVEATAWAVRAIAARMPDSALLEPAVRWLMLNRRAGWWGTTKQSAIALDGVLTYMRARRDTGAVGPVEVFVNGQPAGTHTFTRESLVASTPVEIAAPAAEGANAVRIVARGTGTVHWSAVGRVPRIRRRPRIARARASWRSRARTLKLESTRREGADRLPRRPDLRSAADRRRHRACGSPWPAAATGATC